MKFNKLTPVIWARIKCSYNHANDKWAQSFLIKDQNNESCVRVISKGWVQIKRQMGW